MDVQCLCYLFGYVVLNSCLFSCSGQTSRKHHGLKDGQYSDIRVKRAFGYTPLSTLPVASPADQYCGQWSDWISTTGPMLPLNQTEQDLVSPADINPFCPHSAGGLITDLKCSDNKGEAQRAGYNRTSGDRKFIYSCGQFGEDWGVRCHVVDTNSTCEDFRFKLYCDCDPFRIPTAILFNFEFSSPAPPPSSSPATTATTTSAAPETGLEITKQSVTEGVSANPNPSPEPGCLNNDNIEGSRQYKAAKTGSESTAFSWWIIVIVITSLLFLINLVLSVWLYRKNKRLNLMVNPQLNKT